MYVFLLVRRSQLSRQDAGAVEPGVQGVQLHTHFLAPYFGEDHLFHAKFG